jgi:GTPase SAR1 family protein
MDRRDNEPDIPKLRTVPREEFVEQFTKDYTPSHVTLIGPTRRGKTTLCFQLLHGILARHHKDHWTAVILHGKIKKRDATMKAYARKSNYRITKSWPPGPSPRPKHWRRNVHGYILLPLGNDKMSAAEEEKTLKAEFSRAIRSNYHSTRNVKITVIDERAQADKDLKLTKDLDAPLQRGLPHNPEWNNIQRGAWCSYHCYDAPEHVFLFFDDDDSNVERYSEFGIGDPRGIKEILKNLKTKKAEDGGTISQCLYMRRSDRYMCIVDT